mmetsp:Transcript_4383/g.15209  ORF Transcript_4383/g.15209 Transcript_4383/m.15209 type:complete len:370 (-) Transcript_4383:97-1206(-)
MERSPALLRKEHEAREIRVRGRQHKEVHHNPCRGGPRRELAVVLRLRRKHLVRERIEACVRDFRRALRPFRAKVFVAPDRERSVPEIRRTRQKREHAHARKLRDRLVQPGRAAPPARLKPNQRRPQVCQERVERRTKPARAQRRLELLLLQILRQKLCKALALLSGRRRQRLERRRDLLLALVHRCQEDVERERLRQRNRNLAARGEVDVPHARAATPLALQVVEPHALADRHEPEQRGRTHSLECREQPAAHLLHEILRARQVHDSYVHWTHMACRGLRPIHPFGGYYDFDVTRAQFWKIIPSRIAPVSIPLSKLSRSLVPRYVTAQRARPSVAFERAVPIDVREALVAAREGGSRGQLRRLLPLLQN